VLVALGYPDMASAADAVPALLAHAPLAVEGIDARLVDIVRRHHGPAAVPPLRVIRRDLGAPKAGSLLVLGAGVAGLAAILVVLAGDLTLGGIAAAGFAGAVLLFALLAWGAVKLLRRIVPSNVSGAGVPRWLLLATRQVAARPGFAVMQVSSLAVGLLALALLVLLRTDLIDSWRQATPASADGMAGVGGPDSLPFSKAVKTDGPDRIGHSCTDPDAA